MAKKIIPLVPRVETVMRSVGEYLLSVQKGIDVSYKSENNPVTQADITAQEMLKEGLSKVLPGASFRGEESEWSLWEGFCWVVDPLDGTRAYINREEGWTVCVALFDCDQVVLGAVFDPLNNNFFSATRDDAFAYKNGKKIFVDETREDVLLSSRLTDFGLPCKVITAHGAAFKAVQVAQGLAGGYLHFAIDNLGLRIWDVAATIIIVEKAGGFATCFDGSKVLLRKEDTVIQDVVFANKKMHVLLEEEDLKKMSEAFIQEEERSL